MTRTPNRYERHQLHRRTILKHLGTGAVGTAAAVGTSGTAAADDGDDRYENPIGPEGFGDVSVIRASDGTYYAYGTGMVMARSPDLVNWEPMGRVLTGDDVDWNDVPEDPNEGLWAPNINYYDDQYYLYYTYSEFGSQDNPGIGLATAPDPEGPFTDQGPVFRTEDLPVTNTIDGTMVVVGPDQETNPQGACNGTPPGHGGTPPGQGGTPPGQGKSSDRDATPYMVWGSFWGIHGVELTPDGQDYVPGTEFHVAGDMKEGPMLVPHDGYWYLFYSAGNCCDGGDSTYAVEVGRSESFFGPYYTRDGRDLRNVDADHAGTTVLTGTSRFIGPGHNTAIQDENGDWWMLYHVESTADTWRVMMLDPITWDDDGWPVVGCNGFPSDQNPVPGSDQELCTTPDPAADAEYFRAVFVVDDLRKRLDPSEAGLYESEDRLVQQAVLDRDGVIETDIEDPGSYSAERLAELPEETLEQFYYPGDGLQPIEASNRVSVSFHLDGELRLSFGLYTYPNDDLSADVGSEQVLVDATTRSFGPDHHKVALDLPWDDDRR